MHRRTFAALISALLLGSALTACGSDDDGGGTTGDNSGVTLTMLMGVNNIYPEQQRAWFTEVSSKFQKETGATVRFETFASANDELTKIQTSVVAGQGPDVYALGTTFTPTAYATGAFVELQQDDWDKVGGRDRFLPATLGISGPDEQHQVGIPFASRPFVMAYNKDLLTAAGIDKPADSWDGLRDQAKQLTKDGKYGLAIGYADGFDPWKFIWAMTTQAGSPLVKDGKATLDSPNTKLAYQSYLGWLATDKVVDPAAVGWKNAQAIAAFGEGKAAFLPMVSASSKVTLDKSAVAGKYAYAVMPTIPPGATALPAGGVPATSILSGDNVVVAKYSKHKDLALALVKQLTSEESQTSYYKTFGELPTNQAAAKALGSDPALAAIVDSAGKSVNTPFTGAWGQVQLALTNVVVQSIPDLSAGKVDDGKLTGLLGQAQSTAQGALDKAK
ncbi:carbohydrate ABC transporter substrate-binding protein (CUT1 family) [Asanoa ferruginea]|uniref:Carbohydrate ABC transporter substrate-binding protein (CUT1 family) n=1 Tax=Asanoa ferruginea TaxID=53367 RepID=A0A3D9ZQ95_9ACTN|nr:extracellular solute-binding protein [Asanoa ferruginea]REF99347.1 carbohydrate ABC transporter substrate-binding protein (CUT1 family) [Asanoa ferruginea]GIF45949.1 sugar ABC transporter substrate-binding protein [Asanoa ferruginea]